MLHVLLSLVSPHAGLLPTAIALLEAGQAALHFGEPSVNQLLAAAQELLGLVQLGEPS